jgi:tetratricopeptide (TPR) repeat protein
MPLPPSSRDVRRPGGPAASWYPAGVQVTRDGENAPGPPGADRPQPTEPVPTFEPGDLFGDGESERTVVAALPFELKPRFTGRRPIVDRLIARFEATLAERELAFVALVAEPGMGKSRLVSELGRAALAREPATLVLTGAPDEGAAPHAPIARILAARFGIQAGEPGPEAREKIIQGVSDVLPAARVTEVAHLLAHLMRVPFDDSPVVGPLAGSPQQLESRTFLALRRLLAADAEQHPLILCFENVEQGGAETVNLIHYLAAGLRGARLVLIATATPQLWERHPSFGDGDVALERIELGALSPDDAEQLLRELCRPLDEVPRRLVVHARTMGGSPRALHELVRLLLENDCIVRGPGASWLVDAARLAATALPRTYPEIVAARLAVMEPRERRVLEMCAVIGETCWLDAVVALDRGADPEAALRDPDGPSLTEIAASGDQSRLAVSAALAALVEHEWLVEERESSVPGERELRFAYPNLWSLVYQATDEARRRRHHLTCARWLELRPEGRGPVAQEDVARHLELAGELREAAARYRRAAEAARNAYDNERAIRLYDRALACIGSAESGDIASRIHLWHDLGSVYELIGDFEAALGAFERMLRLSWVVAAKAKAAVAFNKMGRVWRRKGDLRLALEYLERGLELFRSTADARGIAGSLDDIGKVLHLLGRSDEAFAKITEALARRGQRGDKRSIAASLSNLGNVQQDRGQFDAALTCHREALALRREAGDRLGVIVSGNNLSVLMYELGDYAEARAGWNAALTEAEEIGALPTSAMVLCNLGELALVEGKLEEARSRLEDALEIIEDIEDRQLETECCRSLALLDHQLGHAEAARRLAERAIEVAARAGLREKEGLAHLALAQVLAGSLFDADRTVVDPASTQDLPAEPHFKKGVEVLQAIGNDAEYAKGLEAYGRFQIENGRTLAGKDMLREALAVFTRLGMKRAAEVEALLQSV